MSDDNAVFTDIDYQKIVSDFQSQIGALPNKVAPANKKLSESRLRLAAIQALPTVVETEITLKEAIRGTSRTFTVKDQTICLNCVNLKPVNRLQCTECKGVGYQQVERKVETSLAPGLLVGEDIRLPDLGAADIRSGKNGDLVIKIKIAEHPYLKVEGKNITCDLSVTLYQAVLGGEVEVSTATGKVVMNLQPLTQAGRVYRLKGLGLAGGDQLVTIEVNMPQMLTKEQVQLFQKIEAIAGNTAVRNTLASAD